jgi:hypothetical protein
MQLGQAYLNVSTKVSPQHAPVALGQHLKVTPCLRCLYHAKGVFLARHRQVFRVIAGNL